MEDALLQQFHRRLLAMRDELFSLDMQSQASAEPVELDQARMGRLSRMDALQAQQMAMAASRRRRLQLAQIDQALRRADAGEYGDCVRCGEAIAVRRLEVNPLATQCIGCAD